MSSQNDIRIIRDLARQYHQRSQDPLFEQRRSLWRDHNSLRRTRPPVLIRFGLWNTWCGQMFADQAMRCQDPFYRNIERHLRLELFHDQLGDDWVLEPWIPLYAHARTHPQGKWGLEVASHRTEMVGGSRTFDPPIRSEADLERLKMPFQEVDEQATQRDAARMHEAVGDYLTIDIRRVLPHAIIGDISYDLAMLRGIEQIMIDMLDNPQLLHRLAASLRDGYLAAQQEAEQRGWWSRTCGNNQVLPYSHDLTDPSANAYGVGRKDLWGFFAAQEFALISPQMHEEFLLRYQIPLMEPFGLTAYGCCEDLTLKIGLLKQIKNLRRIAVTPWADVGKCAQQIGRDYVMSWRPNPTNMVSAGFDEGRVRRILSEGLKAAEGCAVEMVLKDVETVEGEPQRLKRWVQIAREVGGGA